MTMEAKDTFGEVLERGDSIVYYSYDSLAKGKIIDIEVVDKGSYWKPHPMLLVEKTSGKSYRSQDGVTQLSRITRLDRVAKV